MVAELAEGLINKAMRPLIVILGVVITISVIAGVLPQYTQSVGDIQNGIQNLFLGSVFGLVIGIVASLAIVGMVLEAFRKD